MDTWFSTNVRLICLIETLGSHRYNDSVFVFKSKDFDTAFQRALELGRSLESEFMNGDDQKVLWRLKEIISIDQIGDEFLDGAEVYSEPVEIPENEMTDFSAQFEPEKSEPTQTI